MGHHKLQYLILVMPNWFHNHCARVAYQSGRYQYEPIVTNILLIGTDRLMNILGSISNGTWL